MIERYPGRPQWTDEPAQQRPGTTALRIALLGLPLGALGIAIAMTIQSNWDGTAGVLVGLAVWLLGVLSITAFLAGLVGLFVGIWKRLR